MQAILDQTAEAVKKRQVRPYTPNPLKGKIFCAQCGKALHRQRNSRKKGDDVYSFHCLTPSRVAHDDKLCKGVLIREDRLIPMIMDAMRREMSAELEASALMQSADTHAEECLALSAERKEHEIEIQNLRIRIRGLYEDLVQGIIDKDDYFLFRLQYEEKITERETQIAALEKAIRSMKQDDQRRRSLCKDADILAQRPEMAQELIDRLVERVEITHDKEVRVTFRFQGREE